MRSNGTRGSSYIRRTRRWQFSLRSLYVHPNPLDLPLRNEKKPPSWCLKLNSSFPPCISVGNEPRYFLSEHPRPNRWSFHLHLSRLWRPHHLPLTLLPRHDLVLLLVPRPNAPRHRNRKSPGGPRPRPLPRLRTRCKSSRAERETRGYSEGAAVSEGAGD